MSAEGAIATTAALLSGGVEPLRGDVDVLLVGAGVMSATLGMLLQLTAPGLRIAFVEQLAGAALESSDAWNNAGTGHSALCELNYTPQRADGSIEITRAVKINEQFQQSRQFWATLLERGLLREPAGFINAVPHMSFVSGAGNVEYLRRRFEALRVHPLFAEMEFSADAERLREWIPLMMAGRAAGEPVAATRSAEGTDLDFGALTRRLLEALRAGGAAVYFEHRVRGLHQLPDRRWYMDVEDLRRHVKSRVTARFVFLGAGGGALPLLQRSGVPEGRGYGGFPVSGQWLRCGSREVIGRHAAKVYGKPALGAPPMSMPHLDTRWIGGKRELLFGPFAGFSTKFLKQGSYLDLLRSVGTENMVSMLGAGATNLPLTKYLVGQVMQSQADRVGALKEFVPTARSEDWRLEVAGQRVQIIKRDAGRGGRLEFGTEMVRSADGSLAALLGASPGASTAVAVMLELIEQGSPAFRVGADALREIVPSYRRPLKEGAAAEMERTARVLGLDRQRD